MPPIETDRVTGRARFSRCGRHRYALWREWEPTGPRVLFVGLNPSTADAERDDPTIRRCIQFARDWGYGGLAVGNLFALRTSDPRGLRRAPDPVGPANDRWLERLGREADLVVAAWGAHGDYRARAAVVASRFPRLFCLGTTKAGLPRHPLYVRKDIRPRDLTAQAHCS